MILLADSGSTKTEWKIIKDKIPEESVFTAGINPYFLSENEIHDLLEKELTQLNGKEFRKIYFYGTGCNSDLKNNVVRRALARFVGTDEIFVGSDLLASRSGSFLTELTSSRTIVSPFCVVYLGQTGRPAPFGLPVFIKLRSVPDIFSESFLGLAPPPVWVNIRSVL